MAKTTKKRMNSMPTDKYKYVIMRIAAGSYPAMTGYRLTSERVKAIKTLLDMDNQLDKDYFYTIVLSKEIMSAK